MKAFALALFASLLAAPAMAQGFQFYFFMQPGRDTSLQGWQARQDAAVAFGHWPPRPTGVPMLSTNPNVFVPGVDGSILRPPRNMSLLSEQEIIDAKLRSAGMLR